MTSWFTNNMALRQQQKVNGKNVTVNCGGVTFNVYNRTTIGKWTVSAIKFTIKTSWRISTGELSLDTQIEGALIKAILKRAFLNKLFSNIAQMIQNLFGSGASNSNALNCVLSELVENIILDWIDNKLTKGSVFTPVLDLIMDLIKDITNLLIFHCITDVILDGCGIASEVTSGECVFPNCKSACQKASGCKELAYLSPCSDDSECENGLCQTIYGQLIQSCAYDGTPCSIDQNGNDNCKTYILH